RPDLSDCVSIELIQLEERISNPPAFMPGQSLRAVQSGLSAAAELLQVIGRLIPERRPLNAPTNAYSADLRRSVHLINNLTKQVHDWIETMENRTLATQLASELLKVVSKFILFIY